MLPCQGETTVASCKKYTKFIILLLTIGRELAILAMFLRRFMVAVAQ